MWRPSGETTQATGIQTTTGLGVDLTERVFGFSRSFIDVLRLFLWDCSLITRADFVLAFRIFVLDIDFGGATYETW